MLAALDSGSLTEGATLVDQAAIVTLVELSVADAAFLSESGIVPPAHGGIRAGVPPWSAPSLAASSLLRPRPGRRSPHHVNYQVECSGTLVRYSRQ
jgi:hypothetical protein